MFNSLRRAGTARPGTVGKQPIMLRTIKKLTAKNNIFFENMPYAELNEISNNKLLNIDNTVETKVISNNQYRSDDNSIIQNKIYDILEQEGKTVAELLDEIRSLVK